MTNWKIGITGSAGVGKTSLATALAGDLAVPCLHEEMRAYLERTGTRLSDLPGEMVASILQELWRERSAKEVAVPAFVADNCCLDFAAYALHYGCVENTGTAALPAWLADPLENLRHYDAIFVLPWGTLPYVDDGVRGPSQYQQLRYQCIIEGLLRRYAAPGRLHFLPEDIVDLAERRRWVLSKLRHCPADQPGFVYLVGAGPGDPKLLTVRALELLQRAAVVAFDMLIPEPILALFPPHVEKLNVGRRHGMQKRSYRLHPDVVARAREGKVVVRLKAGDPFVFGRGGEEAEELVQAGIPFEVVPGICAALGAAANTGIPLTHRQYASHVKFVTCHDAETRRPHKELGTTVLYMVAHRLRASLKRLIEDGYPSDTPAAYVEAATTPSQRVITGTLADLHEKVEPGESSAPGLVIAGEVVNLRAIIGRPAC